MANFNLKNTYLGIEFGSTRIKAVLIDSEYKIISSGTHEWENKLIDGYWTYSVQDIKSGLQKCFSSLSSDFYSKYNQKITTVGAIGFSAMMHGYMAFDENDRLLVPFRTWRNTTTAHASEVLSNLFDFHIPQRWSISHLYQAILNDESHVSEIKRITTLAGYIHYTVTGRHEVGIGEASGMFPTESCNYNQKYIDKFRDITCGKYDWDIEKLLPEIRLAGQKGAFLTEKGAAFIDESGILEPGIPVCPPEGDAGTGMVATNSVLPGTGNISAGTSTFSMLVLKKPLDARYEEIDIVATPDGHSVAMVHCNNCCTMLDSWINIFYEFSKLTNHETDKSSIYKLLYNNSLNAEEKCGNIVSCNYCSGEHITNIKHGAPMIVSDSENKINLANLFRSLLYSSVVTLKIGMDVLFSEENTSADIFHAHGGLFKTENIAQQILSNALNTPVGIYQTAEEGGAWGMALLSAFMMKNGSMSLDKWLSLYVFNKSEIKICNPDSKGVKDYNIYCESFKKILKAEKLLEENILC